LLDVIQDLRIDQWETPESVVRSGFVGMLTSMSFFCGLPKGLKSPLVFIEKNSEKYPGKKAEKKTIFTILSFEQHFRAGALKWKSL
jgi:hypothetical protein